MRKIIMFGCLTSMVIMVSALAFAEPGRNVSWRKHPNLAAAQKFVDKAFEKISAAQTANEFDMDGHAQKAKELLDQANQEIKAAAEAANRHEKREERRRE